MDIIKVVLKIMGSSMAVMFLELYMSIFFEKTESPLVTYESDSKKKNANRLLFGWESSKKNANRLLFGWESSKKVCERYRSLI